MKRWIALGVILSILLTATIGALISFFVTDLASAFSNAPAGTAKPNQTLAAPYTEPTVNNTTAPEPTTQPQETAPTEVTVPEETQPSEPEETLPEETLPEETTPEETIPEETIPEETVPEETVPEETDPPPQEETEPDEEDPTEPDEEDTSEPTPVIPNPTSAKYAFVYDEAAGQMLYTWGTQDDRIAMASTTKLFSAYVALQHMDPDTMFTVGEEIKHVDIDSSKAGLYVGQYISVRTCIQGMLLPSGNDAAYAMAVATGRQLLGDPNASWQNAYDAFIDEMNRIAQVNGLSGSHFANPDGIDDTQHYTTPSDMLVIAQLALSNSLIGHTAQQSKVQYGSSEKDVWQNSNRLLHSASVYYCSEAQGLKTGYTSDAGNCLISVFQCGDRRLIIGVFGCLTDDGRYIDTLSLYDACK